MSVFLPFLISTLYFVLQQSANNLAYLNTFRQTEGQTHHTNTALNARQACTRYVRHKTKVFRLSDLHSS